MTTWKYEQKLGKVNVFNLTEVLKFIINLSLLFFLRVNREWNEGGQLWVQTVSSHPATRLEVVGLKVWTKTAGRTEFL